MSGEEHKFSSCFRHGKTLIEDCKCSGWPSTDLDCESTVHTKWL